MLAGLVFLLAGGIFLMQKNKSKYDSQNRA